MFASITYPTAKDFWLKNDIARPLVSVSSRQIKRADTDGTQILEFSMKHHLTTPLHIMVPDASSRYRFGENFCEHVMPKRILKTGFIELDESIYIVSPELCYLLAAKDMNIPELVVFATNLCGIYVLDSKEELGQRSRVPITNVAIIKKFLDKVERVPGLNRARMAIQYALDRSNSPMESRIDVLYSLPFYHGGYAVLPPKLNDNVMLCAAGKEIMGRDYCCCDMVWAEQKVVVEYDSNLVHLNKKQFNYDKRKATALQLSGYTVINVTKENLRNFEAIEESGRLLRRVLGMRPMNDRLKKYRDKRQKMIPYILNS